MKKDKKVLWRRLLKVTGVIIGSIVGICLVLFLILLSWSPGKIEPYYDENGAILADSISEITKVEIGNMEQGMIIKGKNVNNPVLLFLHGGPGNPEYTLAKEVGLEDYFTVCWWEQRGCGMSYSSSIKDDEITLEQMISDTAEVTNYLRERFGKEKIYIMGHSWGSFLGVNTVDKYPELYEAYIGIGQVVNQFKSEKLSNDYMLSAAQANNDEKTIKNLQKYSLISPEDVTADYLMLRSDILSKLGNGVFHIPKSKFNLLLPIFQAREYTLSDIYGYAAGSLLCLKQPINQSQYTMNLIETIPELDVPVYIFHGVHDMQVSYELSRQYFDVLKAPEKYFYQFDNSAHSPFIEEPEKFIEILEDDLLR